MTTARTGTHRNSSGGWTGPGSVAAAEFDIKTVDGRREAWIVVDLVGGYVCAEPDPGLPDGICGMPVEPEPCDIHHPDTTDQRDHAGLGIACTLCAGPCQIVVDAYHQAVTR